VWIHGVRLAIGNLCRILPMYLSQTGWCRLLFLGARTIYRKIVMGETFRE